MHRQHLLVDLRVRFLVVGAVNTVAGYLIFAVFYILANTWLHYLLIALVSHFLAVSFAYTLQRIVVFRSKQPIWPEFLRYNLSLLAVLCTGLLGLYLLVSVIGLPPLVAQALVTILSVIGTYLGHRYFTFRAD